MKILYGVAAFAAIIVWRAGKLPVVHVLMAIRAVRELHLVNRVLAGWDVTLVAFHFGVFAFECVPRRSMRLHVEK